MLCGLTSAASKPLAAMLEARRLQRLELAQNRLGSPAAAAGLPPENLFWPRPLSFRLLESSYRECKGLVLTGV